MAISFGHVNGFDYSNGYLRNNFPIAVIYTEQPPPSARWPTVVILAVLWSIALTIALPLKTALLLVPVGWMLLALALEMRSSRVREVIGLAAPIWLFCLLHFRALRSWWHGDDPRLLTQVLDHGLWGSYVEPVGYFLKPMQLLSLGLDLRLFGLAPTGFYLHHLLAFTLLIAIIYLFLRSYLAIEPAAFAVTLFVASVPAYAVARQLMNRHYLEGLIAALIGLWLYRRSTETGRGSLAILGAVAYLVATSAKEVFVPLVFVLPFIGRGSLARHWQKMVPYGLAAVAYAVWRLSLLGVGQSFSGYGSLSGEIGVFELLKRVLTILGWSGLWSRTVMLLMVAVALWVLARTSVKAALGTVVAIVVLGAPLLPVIGRLEPRHLLLPVLAMVGALLFALWRVTETMTSRLRGPVRTTTGLLLLLISLFGVVHSPWTAQLEASVDRHRLEGQALIEGGFDGLLVTEINHSHHLQCLTRLKRELLGRDDGPGFCGDPCYCASAYSADPLWSLSSDGNRASVVSPPASCSLAAPLEITMSDDQIARQLTWELGPYPQGNYFALMISGNEYPGVSVPVPIPRQGSLANSDPLDFVIRYDSPEGWKAYSPVYQINPGGRARLAN